MSADKSQKNFDATPARKEKAKRDGNVARSAEVSAIAAFACGALVTFGVLPFIGASATHAFVAASAHPDPGRIPGGCGLLLAASLAPAAAAALGAVLAGLVQAGGLRLSMPKWQFSRLNPVAGLKRMAGAETFVGILRAVVAFSAAALALWPLMGDIFARATTVSGPGASAELVRDGAQRACSATIAAGLCFALADFALVRRRWLRGLKMSLEEIRRDQKENDGDPQARARRKALHRTFVRGSVGRTKDASFVVVNPTHIAIAIRYDPPDVAVPEILVRAADDAALRVKSIARRHGVPIVENVALARMLFAQGEAGHAIPAPTFVAVARVIAALIREGVLT